MNGQEAAALLASAAAQAGKTMREFCEGESSVIGTATFLTFEETGVIPEWLAEACRNTLGKGPQRAVDLLDPPFQTIGVVSADGKMVNLLNA